MRSFSKRIALTSCLFIAVFLLPWWVSVVLALVLALEPMPYEILVAGFILDRLYGAVQPSLLGYPMPFDVGPHLFTAFFGIIFLTAVLVKRFLIFYTGYA